MALGCCESDGAEPVVKLRPNKSKSWEFSFPMFNREVLKSSASKAYF